MIRRPARGRAIKISEDARARFARFIESWRTDRFTRQPAKADELERIMQNDQIWLDCVLEPVYVSRLNEYLYQGCSYKVEGPVTQEQKILLIKDLFDAERRKFERLKHKFSGLQSAGMVRAKIPEQVRVEVWRRDNGACAKCGSGDRLEYDHIIPVSKGGSNTARNIELLCESCNRAKQAEIQ
jgi:hypothetical protein